MQADDTRLALAPVVVELTAVIVAVTDEIPRILTVHSNDLWRDERNLSALPFGPFKSEAHRTLELGLRAWVQEQAGVELGYVEQLYTFGNRHRDPREMRGGPRVVSVAYLAFAREGEPSGASKPHWKDWYEFLPWEDWREGRPKILDSIITSELDTWVESAVTSQEKRNRRERVDICFGLQGAPWDEEKVLERFELVYEVCLVGEAYRDREIAHVQAPSRENRCGETMALDHRRILASAIGRLRGKLRYRPVVFELLPSHFTLLQLQRVVEALAGRPLHKQNFRRLVEQGGLVEGSGKVETKTGGRPAELFQFRREVLRERPAPGVRTRG